MSSSKSQENIPSELQQAVASMRKQSVSFGGHNGYFVNHEDMSKIISQVTLLETEGSVDEVELKNFKRKLSELSKDSRIANAELEAKEKELAALKISSAASRTEAVNVGHAWKKAHEKLSTDHKTLLDELELAKAENAITKENSLKAKHGFDPELAIKTNSDHKITAANVTRLNDELSRVNSTSAKLKAQLDQVTKADASRQKELASLYQQVETLRAAKASVYAELEVLKPVVIDINSKWVKRALGDKGLSWFKKACEQKQFEVREQLYHTIVALKSASKNDKKLVGLRDLLQVALDWVKKQTHKVRQILVPWTTQILGDIANGTLKAIKHYRIELEKLVEELRSDVSETSQSYRLPNYQKSFFETLVDETWAWTTVLKNRVVRKSRPVSTRIHRFFSFLKGKVLGVFYKDKGKGKLSSVNEEREKITLHDAEEEELLFKS